MNVFKVMKPLAGRLTFMSRGRIRSSPLPTLTLSVMLPPMIIATTAARNAAAASGNGTLAALSTSQLGALGEQLVNAQFSQGQENAADNFSFDLLTQRNIPRDGLVTAFEKLAKLGGAPWVRDRIDKARLPKE